MSSPPSCVLNANPDICGIGVRVALYMQAFIDLLLTVIVFEYGQLRTTVSTTLITATSLIISAFIQSHMVNGLSLFEAVIITQLITIKLAGIMRFPRGYVVLTTAIIFRALYVAFLFWVWCQVGQFGSQAECNNDIVFKFFGHSVRMTVRWLQVLVLLFNSFVAFVTAVVIADLASTFCYHVPDLWKYIGRPEHEGLTWPDTINLGQLGTIIYLVVTTEQFIDDNQVQNTISQWTFGQTLAVLLVIPSFVEVCQRVREVIGTGEDGAPEPDGPVDVEEGIL
jgi:hypothetical protein